MPILERSQGTRINGGEFNDIAGDSYRYTTTYQSGSHVNHIGSAGNVNLGQNYGQIVQVSKPPMRKRQPARGRPPVAAPSRPPLDPHAHDPRYDSHPPYSGRYADEYTYNDQTYDDQGYEDPSFNAHDPSPYPNPSYQRPAQPRYHTAPTVMNRNAYGRRKDPSRPNPQGFPVDPHPSMIHAQTYPVYHHDERRPSFDDIYGDEMDVDEGEGEGEGEGEETLDGNWLPDRDDDYAWAQSAPFPPSTSRADPRVRVQASSYVGGHMPPPPNRVSSKNPFAPTR